MLPLTVPYGTLTVCGTFYGTTVSYLYECASPASTCIDTALHYRSYSVSRSSYTGSCVSRPHLRQPSCKHEGRGRGRGGQG